MPTEAEIKKIIELYDNGNGLSQGQIAKELKRSKSTIHEWLKNLRLIDSNGSGERSVTKNATQAKITYDRARRLALNDKFMKLVEERIDQDPSNADLKTLATTYGIMVDKREIMEPPTPLQLEDDGFMAALETKTDEVWNAQDIPIQMDSSKPQTVANPGLVDSKLASKQS